MAQWLRHCCRQIARFALPWRIILFFGTLLILWGPFAIFIYWLGYLLRQYNAASILALIFLYVCFVLLAWAWGWVVHRWQKPLKTYGLILCDRFFKDLAMALLSGVGLVVLLFGAQVFLGWASFHPRPVMAIAMEGLLVALGIGLAEELLFRGWLLAELQTGLSRGAALVWSSFLFAAAHFIKPLSEILRTSPQFLGLLLLGLILAMVRCSSRIQARSFQSLGLPIGLHAGLVWGYYIVDVGDLVLPSGLVPEWVTGIHGNPLSGLLGLAILSGLATLCFFRWRLE